MEQTVVDGDTHAVSDIIQFCKDFLILLNINYKTLKTMMDKRDYEMMKLLIENNIYYKIVISREKQARRITL